MQWWLDAKFGLFIHWGLYSLLAGEYKGRKTNNIAEWIMHDFQIPAQEYARIAEQFDPQQFDAEAIVRLAKKAGMGYIVITSKHHEGFAMYDSAASDYTIVKSTPFRRDPIRELAQACQREGIRLGFYYSQAQDWYDENGYEQDADNEAKNFRKYLDEKCKPQLRELLTQYGPVALIWFDTPLIMTAEESKELRDLVKELQPECLVSGRIGSGLGDYASTGDNFIPLLPTQKPWEVPATLNHTWGFNKFDTAWKQPEAVIRNLIKIVSRGGNYLLNIGPDGFGRVPEESQRILSEVGDFMQGNGESIIGTKTLPVYPYDLGWGYLTGRKGKVYIHVLEEKPMVQLLNIVNKIRRAYLLANGEELKFEQRRTCEGDACWNIWWPEDDQEAARARLGDAGKVDMVICVEIEEEEAEFEPIDF
ncbi:MAG: alpha-L-fucosidase [Firmicutes bacterium]|nr:alpha-L-fucosidase [Bacillota bacterium]